MPYLALIRHGQSEWNALGLWTGLTDISLNAEGIAEAQRAADALRDVPVDVAFTSALKRAHETLDEILRCLGRTDLPIMRDAALNERDYGDLTAKNKWKVQEEYGEEQFLRWRRRPSAHTERRARLGRKDGSVLRKPRSSESPPSPLLLRG